MWVGGGVRVGVRGGWCLCDMLLLVYLDGGVGVICYCNVCIDGDVGVFEL